ncbi:MAG: IPT/TIG domain-containing protein [Actinomycetota bacterium]|nr:IPT/TIG domain-containing protein [Actinomycetota bacterium]
MLAPPSVLQTTMDRPVTDRIVIPRTRARGGRCSALIVAAALALLAMMGAAPASGASTAMSWGLNDNGQLGNGTFTGPMKCLVEKTEHACSQTPLAVSGLSEVTAVSAGAFHSLALLASGKVMAWGRDTQGQLGDGRATTELETCGKNFCLSKPVEVSGLSPFTVTAIAGGTEHSIALLSSGKVMAWGDNQWGELGDGTPTGPELCGPNPCSRKPVEVKGLSGVTAIAAGSGFNVALLESGKVMAWGRGEQGQLGNGATTNKETPVEVSGLTEAAAISSGYGHTLALLKAGTVKAWGYNLNGELGVGTTTGPGKCTGVPCSSTPVAVCAAGAIGPCPTGPYLAEVSAIAAGELHGLALHTSGTVAAWGENEGGQLGNGTQKLSTVPVAVSELSGATSIAAGGSDSMVRLSSGTLMDWGENQYGQLGDGTTALRTRPVPVCGLSGVAGMSTRASHSLAFGELTYQQCPTVTKISPSSGTVMGGTTVTITGASLSEVTAVKFGSTNAASFKVISAESIEAVSPAGEGTVDVTVTTPSGSSPKGPADLFTFIRPSVTGLSPNLGPAAGGTSVKISGTNFTGATAVNFGATAASSFQVISPTEITAVSPAGTGVVDVTVTTPEGTSLLKAADRYTYTAAPEFGTCVKVTSGTGGYGSSNCTVAGGTKTYEWYPGFGGSKPLVKTHYKTKAKELPAPALEIEGGPKIICKGETSGGEFSGPKTIAQVTVTLTGCHLELSNCQSTGAKEGEVVSNTLAGELGIVKKSIEGPVKNQIGVDLKPAVGVTMFEFTCGLTTVSIQGSVIVETHVNSMVNTIELKYTAPKTVQKPSRFEGGPPDVFETSLNGGLFHKSGWTATTIQSNEEKLEINTVV